MEVHASYSPALGFSRKFSSYYLPKDGIANAKKEVRGKDLQKRINLYDDCIRYIDSKLEEMIREYEKDKPETIFIITSDHGELFFDNSIDEEEPEQGHDTPSCSDELLKVPLIIYSKETNVKDLFNEEEVITLRETQSIIKSILKGEKYKSKGYGIAENIDRNQTSNKMITDGENKITITQGDSVEDEKNQDLIEIMKEKTEKIEMLEALTWEKEEIEGIDL